MLVASNTIPQVIPVGGSILFDKIILKTGCKCNCDDRRYKNAIRIGDGYWKIDFHGNVSIGSSGSIGLHIAEDGVILPETAMIPDAAANVVVNVSGATIIKNCGKATISVVNNGLLPVAIEADSCLIIERVA